jgi:tRNA threonylcarbamoyl adenosine modification protein (Sua5/YciO/YrdC/YwlC family)
MAHSGPLAWLGDLLATGGLAVFPTDTLYGIGCDAFDQAAVARLLRAKESPPGRPLPMLAASGEDLLELVAPDFHLRLRALAQAFWPGALTVVLPLRRSAAGPLRHCAPEARGGFRVPQDPQARYLAARAGGLLVGSSANRATLPPPAQAGDLDPILLERVDGLWTRPEPCLGLASTVLSLEPDGHQIIRQGAVPAEALARVLD